MDKSLAAEMWEATEGGEMPADFVKTLESYMKHKCALMPLPLTEGDFAACVMNYKLYKSFSAKKASKKSAEKPEETNLEQSEGKEPGNDE